MLKYLFLALNVREDEESQVLLLLGKGFFMGVFLATYQVTAETMFVSELGDRISEGIFVSGLLGVASTAFFAYMQSKLTYSKLAIFNLIAVMVVTSVLYIAYIVAPPEYHWVVIFSIFAAMGPMTAVVLLGFWGIFGRMFNLRQSKRIIGGIDTGQLSAAILTFFTIGLIASQIPRTVDLMVVSVISLVFSIAFLIRIINKYDLGVVKAEGDVGTERVRYKDLFKNHYAVLLALFMAFSIMGLLFVQNSYLNVLDQQYPAEEETQLRGFLAWFNGTILILSFVMQTFFNDRIIGGYGLKVSLLILPIILGFFTIVSIVTGSLFGFTNESPSFFWFFLFIAMTKLFAAFLHEALELPAFKLYFMPLDIKIRFDIQAKVEGVVNEFAKLVAGGMILLLGLLTFFKLIHYSYFLIIIIAAWIFVVGKLYTEYRNRIRLKLERQQQSASTMELGRNLLVKELQEELRKPQPAMVVFAYKLLEKINPGMVGRNINIMLHNEVERIKEYAQTKMNEIKGLSVSDQYIIGFNGKGKSSNGRQVVTGVDLDNLLMTGEISKKRIAKLSRSENVSDRLYAAELIGNTNNTETISYLVDLLHDNHGPVRIAAMKTAQRKYNTEVLGALIDNLGSPVFGNEAVNTLVQIGYDCLPVLDSAFYRAGQSSVVMIKIVQIFGRIGGNSAKNLLWSKIDYPDKVLVIKTLSALGECGFKANLEQTTRIKYAIESDISDIAWNLAALSEVPEEAVDLTEAIREENQNDMNHIYMLLSMLYDARSIQLVKENIESGTNEGITYAIELLDVFLSEDLKQKVIPLLDDVSDLEKAKKLENFFPRFRMTSLEMLRHLINRDYNQTDRWAKSCAIHWIGENKVEEFTKDLIANLFNPDRLVQEISAWALYQIDQEVCDTNIRRLEDMRYRELNRVIKGIKHGNESPPTLMFEKILFMNKIEIFSSISGLTLSSLVNLIREVNLLEGETYSLETKDSSFFIVYSGSLNYFRQGSLQMTLNTGDFLGEIVEDESLMNSNLLIAQENSVLFELNKDEFYEILSDNTVFAKQMVEFLNVE